MFFDVKDVKGRTWTVNAEDVVCLQPAERIEGNAFGTGMFVILRNGMSITVYDSVAAKVKEQLWLYSTVKAHGA
jgi:hypothetical protein